jgi:mono/diheme cytochrome c family protein
MPWSSMIMKLNYLQPLLGRAVAAVLWGSLVLLSNLAVCAGETNEVFMKSCASCHGKDGTAQTSVAKKLGVKDLSQSKLTDAQIEQQIREGKPASQSAAKMPAFKDRLSAEEIKSLVAIVKEFRR